MTTLIPKFDFTNGGSTPTGAINRPINQKLAETVSVLDFGAIGNGTTDDTTAIQNAVNSGAGTVHFPKGSYLISTPIQLPFGIIVYGDSAGNSSFIGTTITNNQVGGGCFWMTTSTSTGQGDGATITNFNLISDYPIMLNNPTTLIVDGGASPYYMKPKINNVLCQARVIGTGTGISFSKCFDFEIARCVISNFNTGILLQGSDVGFVHTNRIYGSTAYQILEIGTGTFGSQTEIRNNDVLAGGTGSTYIKSCGRFPRIYDNYLELNSGSASIAIDLTNVNCPQFGSNVPAVPISIVCRDNRIDGQSNFNYVYLLDNRQDHASINIVLHDSGTAGNSGTTLYIYQNGYLPVIYNSVHYSNYDIKIPNGTTNYQNFKTGRLPSVFNGTQITSDSLSNGAGLQGQNAGNYIGYNGSESFVIYPTMTGSFTPLYLWLPSYGTLLHPLEVGATYTVYITARSPSSESLNVGPYPAGPLVSLALIPSYKTLSAGTFTAPASTVSCGAYIQRITTTDNIFVQSITFVKS